MCILYKLCFLGLMIPMVYWMTWVFVGEQQTPACRIFFFRPQYSSRRNGTLACLEPNRAVVVVVCGLESKASTRKRHSCFSPIRTMINLNLRRASLKCFPYAPLTAPISSNQNAEQCDIRTAHHATHDSSPSSSLRNEGPEGTAPNKEHLSPQLQPPPWEIRN